MSTLAIRPAEPTCYSISWTPLDCSLWLVLSHLVIRLSRSKKPPVDSLKNRDGATPRGMSELDADAELVAPIDQRPTRIPIHGLGSRGRRRITKYLLLVRGLGVQQVGPIERQLDM